MKLIIDIDKELKSAVYRCGLFLNPTEKTSLIDAINNGTPIPDNATNVLDAIKLEIKQEYDNQGNWSFNDGLAFALEIIDKYAKENRNEQV